MQHRKIPACFDLELTLESAVCTCMGNCRYVVAAQSGELNSMFSELLALSDFSYSCFTDSFCCMLFSQSVAKAVWVLFLVFLMFQCFLFKIQDLSELPDNVKVRIACIFLYFLTFLVIPIPLLPTAQFFTIISSFSNGTGTSVDDGARRKMSI